MSKFDFEEYARQKKEYDAMTPEEQKEYLGDDWDVGPLGGKLDEEDEKDFLKEVKNELENPIKADGDKTR